MRAVAWHTKQSTACTGFACYYKFIIYSLKNYSAGYPEWFAKQNPGVSPPPTATLPPASNATATATKPALPTSLPPMPAALPAFPALPALPPLSPP